MPTQSALDQQAIDILPFVSAIIDHSEPFEANQIRCSVLRACSDSPVPISNMDNDELLQFQLECIEKAEKNEWFSRYGTTEILSCEIADFCDEGTTIKVTATDLIGEHAFYVQTVDFQHRADLGCLLTPDEDDTSEDDYPLISFDKIIKHAEQYVQSRHNAIHVRAGVYMIVKPDGSYDVVQENSNFINSASSSYQRQYSAPYGNFDSESDARGFIELTFDKNGFCRTSDRSNVQ